MQAQGLFDAEQRSEKPDQIEACPTCGAEILKIESPEEVVLGCSVDESHYFQRLDREPETEPVKPSLELRMVCAPTARVSGRRPCFSDDCAGVVEFENGRGTCPSCGLDQRIVDLDQEDLSGRVINFKK